MSSANCCLLHYENGSALGLKLQMSPHNVKRRDGCGSFHRSDGLGKDRSLYIGHRKWNAAGASVRHLSDAAEMIRYMK